MSNPYRLGSFPISYAFTTCAIIIGITGLTEVCTATFSAIHLDDLLFERKTYQDPLKTIKLCLPTVYYVTCIMSAAIYGVVNNKPSFIDMARICTLFSIIEQIYFCIRASFLVGAHNLMKMMTDNVVQRSDWAATQMKIGKRDVDNPIYFNISKFLTHNNDSVKSGYTSAMIILVSAIVGLFSSIIFMTCLGYRTRGSLVEMRSRCGLWARLFRLDYYACLLVFHVEGLYYATVCAYGLRIYEMGLVITEQLIRHKEFSLIWLYAFSLMMHLASGTLIFLAIHKLKVFYIKVLRVLLPVLCVGNALEIIFGIIIRNAMAALEGRDKLSFHYIVYGCLYFFFNVYVAISSGTCIKYVREKKDLSAAGCLTDQPDVSFMPTASVGIIAVLPQPTSLSTIGTTTHMSTASVVPRTWDLTTSMDPTTRTLNKTSRKLSRDLEQQPVSTDQSLSNPPPPNTNANLWQPTTDASAASGVVNNGEKFEEEEESDSGEDEELSAAPISSNTPSKPPANPEMGNTGQAPAKPPRAQTTTSPAPSPGTAPQVAAPPPAQTAQ